MDLSLHHFRFDPGCNGTGDAANPESQQVFNDQILIGHLLVTLFIAEQLSVDELPNLNLGLPITPARQLRPIHVFGMQQPAVWRQQPPNLHYQEHSKRLALR